MTVLILSDAFMKVKPKKKKNIDVLNIAEQHVLFSFHTTGPHSNNAVQQTVPFIDTHIKVQNQ